MLEVKWRRQPGDPETITAYGQEHDGSGFVEIDDRFAEKAKGNPSFEVKGERSFGDERPSRKPEPVEAQERRQRAEVTKAGQEETRKARQAEARADERG